MNPASRVHLNWVSVVKPNPKYLKWQIRVQDNITRR